LPCSSVSAPNFAALLAEKRRAPQIARRAAGGDRRSRQERDAAGRYDRQRRLDALLYHQSDVATRRRHTDGGGDSDHVFALCTLLGFQFAPRIPDLKHRRLYSFDKPSAYSTLEPLIAGRINVALIRAH
jgi:hypothetical protein